MKVKLKNNLIGTLVKDTSIIFENDSYSHTVPSNDILYEVNSKLLQEIERIIEENTITVYTRDYGNIDVVDIDSLCEVLNEYKVEE